MGAEAIATSARFDRLKQGINVDSCPTSRNQPSSARRSSKPSRPQLPIGYFDFEFIDCSILLTLAKVSDMEQFSCFQGGTGRHPKGNPGCRPKSGCAQVLLRDLLYLRLSQGGEIRHFGSNDSLENG